MHITPNPPEEPFYLAKGMPLSKRDRTVFGWLMDSFSAFKGLWSRSTKGESLQNREIKPLDVLQIADWRYHLSEERLQKWIENLEEHPEELAEKLTVVFGPGKITPETILYGTFTTEGCFPFNRYVKITFHRRGESFEGRIPEGEFAAIVKEISLEKKGSGSDKISLVREKLHQIEESWLQKEETKIEHVTDSLLQELKEVGLESRQALKYNMSCWSTAQISLVIDYLKKFISPEGKLIRKENMVEIFYTDSLIEKFQKNPEKLIKKIYASLKKSNQDLYKEIMGKVVDSYLNLHLSKKERIAKTLDVMKKELPLLRYEEWQGSYNSFLQFSSADRLLKRIGLKLMSRLSESMVRYCTDIGIKKGIALNGSSIDTKKVSYFTIPSIFVFNRNKIESDFIKLINSKKIDNLEKEKEALGERIGGFILNQYDFSRNNPVPSVFDTLLKANAISLIKTNKQVKLLFPEQSKQNEEIRSFSEQVFVRDAKEAFRSLKKTLASSAIFL